jgi:hypothetical protein
MEWAFLSLTRLRRSDLLGLTCPPINLGLCASLTFIVWCDRGPLPMKREHPDQGGSRSKEGDPDSIWSGPGLRSTQHAVVAQGSRLYQPCHISFLSPSQPQCSAVACISLHHPVYNHISISHVSLLSPNQLHHSRLNYLKIHFMGNEFKKIN